MMELGRYSNEQVLIGLRSVWQELGFDAAAVKAEQRIDLALRATGDWEEIDFADVIYCIERYFGFKATDEEWGRWFGARPYVTSEQRWEKEFAPRFTFGGLAEFVAARAEAPAFAPMYVFGRSCEPAGAFRLIQRIVTEVSSRSHGFAPSTLLSAHLSVGQMRRLWGRLRMLTCDRMPQLASRPTAPLERFVAHCLSLWPVRAAGQAALALALIAATVAGCLFLALATLALLGLAAWAVVRISDESCNPLPPQIKSFRDLSVALAEARPEPRAPVLRAAPATGG
jgi:hypothetical protein